MKITNYSYTFLVLLAFLSACKTTQIVQSEPEVKDIIPAPASALRGYVVLPESWIDDDTDTMKKNIGTIINSVAKAHYNTLFFYVREGAETYYPSCFEPWSGNLEYKSPGFDPLGFAIEKAHEHKLKIYAGVGLLTLCDENNPPGITDHLYFKHGPGVSPDSTWSQINSESNDQETGETLLNPSHPQVKTYLKSITRDLVENYNLDGLCFDLTTYTTGLKDLIEDIVVEAMLVKPYLVNSIIYHTEKENQRIINCLEEGIVDFIVPEINMETGNSDQYFTTKREDTIPEHGIKLNVFPMLTINDTLVKEEIIKSLVEEGRGIVLNYKNLQADNSVLNQFHFTDKIDFPDDLKQIIPEQVVGLNLTSLFPDNYSGQKAYLNKNDKIKITDSQGKFGFISSQPDTIEIETSGGLVILPTRFWAIPYKYAIQPDNTVVRESPWVEFRRMPGRYTDLHEYDLLCRTEYPASVWINNDPVKIYKTGVFFNKIILNEGSNRVRASVVVQDSLSIFYEREFVYEKTDNTREPLPLWVDKKSVEPTTNLELLPEDIIRVSFQGSLRQDGYIAVNPGGLVIDCSREDYEDYSLYKAELKLNKLTPGNSYIITLGLTTSIDSSEFMSYKLDLPHYIKVRDPDDFPLVKVVNEHSRLTYNLGPIRLGGPIRSELGPGIIMKTNGKIGENYRIRLNRIETGIIHKNNVEELPPEAVQPTYFITNMSCAPVRGADVVSIPYLEPVPYMVYPDPDQNRIVVTLYGAKTSSTWITHHKGRKVIDNITWKQITPETYEVYVNLKSSKIWGYEIRERGKRLQLNVKYPPKYNLDKEKPLTGLKIAIEAGHGGRNTGAIGLSGLLEKEINLDLSLKLGELCRSMGAEIVQVRDSDKNMSLIEKRDIVQSSKADLFISIHANAAGGGYLRVPGTSTYYHNPFWAPLAENIYDRLLELELEEFGVIGSFNYTVIRVSQMPSILVEQAFMSHAEDEEKLADPEFRQQMARKIYDGILDYLRDMKE